jgi:hypothetical protein
MGGKEGSQYIDNEAQWEDSQQWQRGQTGDKMYLPTCVKDYSIIMRAAHKAHMMKTTIQCVWKCFK